MSELLSLFSNNLNEGSERKMCPECGGDGEVWDSDANGGRGREYYLSQVWRRWSGRCKLVQIKLCV